MQPPLLDEEVTFEAPSGEPRVLILACGAIAREIVALIRSNGWDHVTLACLPGKLHNTPREIALRVDAKLREAEASGRFERLFVAYADCGTGGELDRVLERHGVERIPGPHCYGFFAGNDAWLAMHEAEPGTFYLTDFLCRNFEPLVVRGLGLDRRPELKDIYFAGYTRLIYLAQTDDPELDERAQRAAGFLGFRYERVRTGYGELATSLDGFVEGVSDGR